MHESGEMYLETIYILSIKNPAVRSIDIAEYMGFSKPSVSRGISILKRDGYLVMKPNGYLELTQSGLTLAKKIYERHTVLTKLLMALGVDEKIAAEDACKMEHVISDETFDAMKKHISQYSKE